MVLGLVVSIALAHGSIVKALAMVVLGLLLGLVGTDIYTGTPRFTFGIRESADGLELRRGGGRRVRHRRDPAQSRERA